MIEETNIWGSVQKGEVCPTDKSTLYFSTMGTDGYSCWKCPVCGVEFQDHDLVLYVIGDDKA